MDDPRGLVKLLALREGRTDTIRRLVGGVTATELRQIRVAQPVLSAVAEGVHDPDPRVRWWCVQLLDHINDERALTALTDALDDPVPRVRRNAAHAVGCVACKPPWDGSLPDGAADRLLRMAEADPNAKVRAQAQRTLRSACSWPANAG
jgi:HEAT repeat protein